MFDQQTERINAEIAPVTEKPRDRNAERRADYERRVADKQCIRCKDPAAPDSLWCARHGEIALTQARAWSKARRKDRRSHGLCGECGQPKSKRTKTVVRQVTIPATAAAWHTEGKRVAARTTRTLEKNGDPSNWGFRTRFHGQGHRGHPSREQEDAWDLRSISKELELGATALAYWHSAEVQAMPRIQRDAVLREALAHFELIDRQLEELVERAGRRLR